MEVVPIAGVAMVALGTNMPNPQLNRTACKLRHSGDRFSIVATAGLGTEYAFARMESCRSWPLKAERRVSGGLLPDERLRPTAVMAELPA
jgi:hypothetical protein